MSHKELHECVCVAERYVENEVISKRDQSASKEIGRNRKESMLEVNKLGMRFEREKIL